MTTMFDFLSKEIKNIIFSKVQYEASQEWWALAMASFKRTLKHNDRFLLFLVSYCNEVKPKEGEEWTWWMMMEFTKSKSIELTQDDLADLQSLTEYYKERGIRVRKLKCHLPEPFRINVTESFPYLISLNLSGGTLDNMNGPLLPDGIEKLQLNDVTFKPRRLLSSIIRSPTCLKSLSLTSCIGLICDTTKFENLKHLHLLTTKHLMIGRIERFLSDCKQLTSITLENGLIDKQWEGLFPSTFESVILKSFGQSEETRAMFGPPNSFVERKLMKYVCQDWTQLLLFKSVVIPSGEQTSFFTDYVCRPQLLEEEIMVVMKRKDIPIGLLDSGDLKITRLKYIINLLSSKTPRLEYDFPVVPKSVKCFELDIYGVESFSFANLFEDVSCIETMVIQVNDGMILANFPLANNLLSLDISGVNHVLLESIIKSCPSLKRLCLTTPKALDFEVLPETLESTSLKLLRITEFQGPIRHILRLFPRLEEIFLEEVAAESLAQADLKTLESMKVVRIECKSTKDGILVTEVIRSLANLKFSHLVLGWDKGFRLSCIMGDEEWFLKRFIGSPEDEFSEERIFGEYAFSGLFFYTQVHFFRGLFGKFTEISKSHQLTYDLEEFINIVSNMIQRE